MLDCISIFASAAALAAVASAGQVLGLLFDLPEELGMRLVEFVVTVLVLLHVAITRPLRRVYRALTLLEARGWDLGSVYIKGGRD